MTNLPAHAVRAAGVCVAGAIACAAPPADAAFSLQIDVNSLTAEFSPSNGAGFGENASGFVMLGEDGNSTLNGIKLDGVDQSAAVGATGLSFFSGMIELTNGTVVGGSLDIILTDGSRYSATIEEGSGRVLSQAGQGYMIDGLSMFGAFFNPPTTFGGVDVTGIGDAGLLGSFLTFAFNPDGQSVDTDTDIDIWVVPAPTTAAIFGLAGLAAARRRRA